ncbi:MAG TPA: MDR family oxidoreductase [Rhizomicrobium sp.]|jgi:acrylyl-CoA reductase (NADPH)|nr:MDR family oxidoreductase [Rhizomicrobium sp.]
MSDRFKALLITKENDSQTVTETELSVADLMEGDVTIAVSHSTVNYKDGLALTGRSPVVRRSPMIPGVDLAGVVTYSTSPAFHEGERVLVNGFGLGETHYGGYAGCARVKGDWVLRIPEPFSNAEAMAIGTAGYTAMLGVLALEDAGVTPEKGPVLVTGAAGGVGSVAVALLAKLGYRVIASTGREEEAAYLSDLGAQEIIPRRELQGEVRPLARERWAGAIDSVGSTTVANVLSATSRGGAVAACGLAQGLDLPASVAPFILRGVSLLGIESVHMNMPRRRQAWARLARDIDRQKLACMTGRIGLRDLLDVAGEILAGRIRGRLVVDVAS